MGHDQDWIPWKELEFKAWADNLITKLQGYKITLGISAQTVEELQEQLTAYEQFENMISGGDIKHQNIVNRNNARDVLKTHIREVVARHIRFNPAAHDGILADLLLPIPDTERTPRHVPQDVTPGFRINRNTSGRHFFEFGTWEDDAKFKLVRGKPDYAEFIEIVRQIGGTMPIADDMESVALQSKSPVEFIYSAALRGTTVYYACRWRNDKGEAGPWSDVQSAIIN
ncbi:MAG: hypothetical protein LBR17_01495 [Bacteroidales bacterium]|jgi:hypothetical protein|nr:hypothetical protein [Bacteroidales bacterium]